ncbi:hypothetical protein [Rhodopirellula bahusiensis]|uniref:Uncharacterized protein n=1 Tax=Rhodopirellula bahusiensis TaxID=2014065 RepID=A0A2G1VYI7_9BACT|nr:hypothetical protein [Rhodopirellula bahusiensis]PHQ31489.1 hypothetical protein CEE69_30785 [Rhodopirellula bahusiensis]
MDMLLRSTGLQCAFSLAITPVLRAIADTLTKDELTYYWSWVDPNNVFHFEICGGKTLRDKAVVIVTRGPGRQFVLEMKLAHSLREMRLVNVEGNITRSGWNFELPSYHPSIEDVNAEAAIEMSALRMLFDQHQSIGCT